MRKLMALIIIGGLVSMLSGCSLLEGTPLEGLANSVEKPLIRLIGGDKPEKQLKTFVAYLQNKDYEKAHSLLSDKTGKKLTSESLKRLTVSDDYKLGRVEFQDPQKDQAVIYYSFGNSAGFMAELEKQNGEWKIKSYGKEIFE